MMIQHIKGKLDNIKNKCHIKKPEKLELAVKQFKDLQKAIDNCR